MTKNPVPFKIGNVYGGLAECHGLIRDDGDHLCLEFRTQDSVLGALKGEIKQALLPLKQLASVSLTKGSLSKGWLGTTWWGAKIVIQSAQMDILKDVPGMSQGRVRLSIARNDVEAAEEFVARINRQEDEIH